VLQHGFRRYLAAQKVQKGNGEQLKCVFSKERAQLIEALVSPYPETRLTLAERIPVIIFVNHAKGDACSYCRQIVIAGLPLIYKSHPECSQNRHPDVVV